MGFKPIAIFVCYTQEIPYFALNDYLHRPKRNQ
jgi:hypothetical protein